jgi:hypothetical protein
MESLRRAWGLNTALVGQDVKGTFSRGRRFLAGLSRQDTLEAGGEDLGQFRYSMFRVDHGHQSERRTFGKTAESWDGRTTAGKKEEVLKSTMFDFIRRGRIRRQHNL